MSTFVKSLVFLVLFVLLVGVVLYVTRTPKGDTISSAPNTLTTPSMDAQGPLQAQGTPNLAFVRSDVVAQEFQWMANQKNILKARLQKAESEWEGEASRFQKDLQDFQRKAGGMGESQRQITEQSLARREQNLVQMREGMVAELAQAEEALDARLRKMMEGEFKAFAQEGGYQYLLAMQPGSGLLYGDSAADVTQRLVDFLNKRHPR
ncbi:MAG: OmpH family outer membrane protein [Bacteroidia bacterium]